MLTEWTTNWLSFHDYDGERRGTPTLGLRRLLWTRDDWPELQ